MRLVQPWYIYPQPKMPKNNAVYMLPNPNHATTKETQ